MYYKNAPYGKPTFPADFNYSEAPVFLNQPSRTTQLMREDYTASNPTFFNTTNTITDYLTNPWVVGTVIAVIILLLLWWYMSSQKQKKFSY